MGKGKGSSPPPPPAIAPQTESLDSIMGPIMAMASQTAMLAARPPEIPTSPEIATAPDVDWAAKFEELKQKVRADYDAAQEERKTRESTVHASDIYKSPLVDEETNTDEIPRSSHTVQ